MASTIPHDEPGQNQNQQEYVPPEQLHDILASDASKGATVHSFSPEASPEVKAAAAGEGLEKIVPHANTELTSTRGVLLHVPSPS